MIMSAYGVKSFIFCDFKWFWLFWVVFGWLRLVLGGQKWLLAVMSGYQVFVLRRLEYRNTSLRKLL